MLVMMLPFRPWQRRSREGEEEGREDSESIHISLDWRWIDWTCF
jgi:hypothetical protein